MQKTATSIAAHSELRQRAKSWLHRAVRRRLLGAGKGADGVCIRHRAQEGGCLVRTAPATPAGTAGRVVMYSFGRMAW